MAPNAFEAPPPPATPSTIKHYELRGQLGEGGFGQVFEAWDSKLHRTVAIKRVKQAARDGGHDLLREARMAASLHHPAFVKIHAIEAEDDDSQSIVMEYVAGSTLRQVMAQRSLAPQEALDIIAQLAQAMRVAHAANLVHGDLKPANVILDPSGAVRILDFGLASSIDPQATMSLAAAEPQGTIAYMAPERLQGGRASPRTDMFSLGVMLYELLCGVRPFAGLNGLALAAAQVQSSSEQWTYPDGMPAALIDLMTRMTIRRPEQRLADMTTLCDDIAQLALEHGYTVHSSRVGVGPEQSSLDRLAFERLALDPQVSTRAMPNALPSPSPVPLPKLKPAALRWPHIAAVGTLALVAVGLAAWQVLPSLGILPAAYAPYSESRAMQQGLAALRQYDQPGSLDIAEQNFSAILAHEPRHAAATAGLSLSYSFRYSSDGQDPLWLQRADASAQQAIALNDGLGLSHVARTLVLVNQGQADAALVAANRALALDPQEFFALLGKMYVLIRLGRDQDAIQVILAGFQSHPNDPAFSTALGLAYEHQGELPLAEQAYRSSIAQQPDGVRAYANLSIVLLRQNRRSEALQALQQGLQVRASATLNDMLGNALFKGGDYVGAAAAFEHAVSQASGNPGHYLYWANLGDALRWLPGRAPDARRAYGKAQALLATRLETAPNDSKLISRMGLYAARNGNRAISADMAARALALAPQNPDVHFRAGLAHELLGDRVAALAAITAAQHLGYPAHLIESEPDLLELRRDVRYSQH